MELALELTVLLGVCLVISAVAIRLSVTLVSHLGIMDRPGGHKQHDAGTPFVGGFGLIAVLASMSLLGDTFFGGFLPAPLPGLVLGALLIFLTGLADDIWHLGFKVRFLVQALVALLMIFVGGVELDSLGELFPGLLVDLGWLAVPITVFATIGLINALNMIDGIDGLSGSVSLASLALAAVIAHDGGSDVYVFLIVALMGGIGGFLYFNLRYPGNRRARVFLGDNGSTLLGFLFAWIFIALSQGERAAMTPVTALWLFALPLMDTVGVMLRRLWLGRSPFRPDRHHLHHLFVRAGFRVCDVVAFAGVMQVTFALVGVGGLLLGIPEYLMFWLFLGVFAVYCLLILRPWRLVPWLRRVNRWLGMPSAQVRGIFVGYLGKERCPEVLAAILEGLGSSYDYQLGLYEMDSSRVDGRNVYCIVHVPTEGDELLIGRVQRHAERLRRQLAGPHGLEVRLFVAREQGNDRRVGYAPVIAGSNRVADRRRTASTLIYSLERGQRTLARKGAEFELSAPPPCT